jgi:hypothetical protein
MRSLFTFFAAFTFFPMVVAFYNPITERMLVRTAFTASITRSACVRRTARSKHRHASNHTKERQKFSFHEFSSKFFL